MIIPKSLLVLIADNEDTVDQSVLVNYMYLLRRAEEAEKLLRDEVTSEELTDACDRFKTARSTFFHTKASVKSYNPSVEIEELNIGLRSGLSLETLASPYLYGVTVKEIIEIATEGAWSGSLEVLLAIDTLLRDDDDITYPEIFEIFKDSMPVKDKRNWIKRWAIRRSYHSDNRLTVDKPTVKSAKGEEIRLRCLSLWETEKAVAKIEGRKPSKKNIWNRLCELSDKEVEGKGDKASIWLEGVNLTKMRFYQWIYRADKESK